MTFARLAKIAAVLLVAFALWRARSTAAPVHVVVLAVPGASSDLFTAGDGSRTLARGPITLPAATSGSAFWKRLFAATTHPAAELGGLDALWGDGESGIRVVSAPASLFGKGDEDPASAFVGSSAGAVVESEDITSGRLPAPYDRAADAVVASAASLGRDEWSDWISVDQQPGAPAGSHGPTAQFQLARVTESTYFLSPAYLFRESPFVHRAFLRGKEREMRPLVATHAIAVSRRRLDPAHNPAMAKNDGRPAVVFDTAAEDAIAVFAPDTTPSGVLEQVRSAIAADAALLRRADDSRQILIALGGPTTSRPAETAAWYQVVELRGDGSSEGLASQPLDFEAARAMVRYALGAPLDDKEKGSVPVALVQAAPDLPRTSDAAAPAGKAAERTAWSAESLESVPGAVTSGR